MSKLNTILESEEYQVFESENQDVINEMDYKISNFSHVAKAYVLANPGEFIAENLDETYKNIVVFTEAATAQYMAELSAMYGSYFAGQEIQYETTVDDYI